ncbi:pre-rRNA 2'-O-ribose RNA methyltransferase FTSJ3 [Planococcus citri]|uniref:pre-rRNA 2'-O-ribose RNA methyltransferase FTSJ3 n=1 Tax=Planococcus citri TaxID=170843 RepID=UPI0031F97526
MGKKSKIGRQRKDKFYHLAKETGYRSRAAFKLIQLNRKFEFLQKARVLIDLCAAPGGWMQVAKQNMPVSSIVIGVDMFPMKPVPGCISLLEDITSEKCKASLRKELKTWKADVVLHDGAPNLGKNWLHDAYNQNCLTLSALKLATAYLREGGWFVSKVFRSKDYNCLLWVFKQLFKKVHATKPPASRNESAEIFVVCQGYIAPAKLDPRFMNPNYVFKELDVEKPVTVQSLLKSVDSTKKSKAEGYDDDAVVLHTKLPASVFMSSDNPAAVLQNAFEIVFDDDEILNHPKTTDEIKRCCEDIKVLGKKELRSLLSWWKSYRQDKQKSEEPKKSAEPEKPKLVPHGSESDEEKELDDVSKQIDEMIDEEKREAKRKRKKVNKERAKLQMKMNLNMRNKDDLGPTEQEDTDVFKLSQITSKRQLDSISDQRPDIMAESDDEENQIPVKKSKKVSYDAEKSYLDETGTYYRTAESESEGEDEEIDSDVEGLGLEKEAPEKKPVKRVRFLEPEADEDMDENNSNPLITDLDFRDTRDKRLSKAKLWFDKDVFKDVENEEDEDYELDTMTLDIQQKGGKVLNAPATQVTNKRKQADDDVSDDNDDEDDDDDDGEDDDSSGSETEEEKENKPIQKNDSNKKLKLAPRIEVGDETQINEWDVDNASLASEKKRKKKERKVLDAEGLAMGALIVNSKKSKRDLFDAGWNRYAFNDENLPEWFVDDEKKHMRKDTAVPPELITEYTKSREEIDSRPIKKVAEAKARNKRRAAKKLDKLKKKLEGVMDNPDMTEAEKAKQAKQMYRKIATKKPEIKYLVAKKHTAAKRVRRPKGLKGPFKVVDPRMKKDLRGKVHKETKNKSKKSASKIKRSYKPKNRGK